MKFITCHEPWASMICRGPKDVENRTRKWNHVGPVIIHASQTFDHDAFGRLKAEGHINESWRRENFPPGVIGLVLMAGCHYRERGETYMIPPDNEIGCEAREWSPWHEPGHYGYYLYRRTHFAFRVDLDGTQFVGNVPDEALAEILWYPRLFRSPTLDQEAPNP